MAATTAIAAANEFLSLASEDGLGIDQMKLQKLLFYAHAWNLAIKGSPLFDDPIEAWPWGPVVRSVYAQTSGFGRKPVDKELLEVKKVGSGFLDYKYTAPDKPDADTKAFIASVWNSYKKYTGIQLSNTTHAPGEPWTIIKDRVGDLDKAKPIIPNDLIEEVFKKKLADDGADANTAAR